MLSLTSYVVVQSLSHVQFFANSWAAAGQASLSFSVSQSLLKLMSMRPSHPLLSPFSPALNPPQHQGFSSESALRIRQLGLFPVSPQHNRDRARTYNKTGPTV